MLIEKNLLLTLATRPFAFTYPPIVVVVFVAGPPPGGFVGITPIIQLYTRVEIVSTTPGRQ